LRIFENTFHGFYRNARKKNTHDQKKKACANTVSISNVHFLHLSFLK